ncbi:MAG: hypothetical protein IIY01_02500 [Clostridia bacterium]|nr:hypothetical protein [Clostridia bacterium]
MKSAMVFGVLPCLGGVLERFVRSSVKEARSALAHQEGRAECAIGFFDNLRRIFLLVIDKNEENHCYFITNIMACQCADILKNRRLQGFVQNHGAGKDKAGKKNGGGALFCRQNVKRKRL